MKICISESKKQTIKFILSIVFFILAFVVLGSTGKICEYFETVAAQEISMIFTVFFSLALAAAGIVTFEDLL